VNERHACTLWLQVQIPFTEFMLFYKTGDQGTDRATQPRGNFQLTLDALQWFWSPPPTPSSLRYGALPLNR